MVDLNVDKPISNARDHEVFFAWVAPEIKRVVEQAQVRIASFEESLELSRSSYKESLETYVVPTLDELHALIGVLHMVGEVSLARYVNCIKSVLLTWDLSGSMINGVDIALIKRAIEAFHSYVVQRLQGPGTCPVILFPIYKDLQLGLGNSFADPVDLWAADLKWNAVDAGGKYVLVPDPIVRVLFDRFLLLVLQGRDRHAAGKLAVLCTGLAKGCASSEQGTFWVMAAAVLEALHCELLLPNVYVKRALSAVLQRYVEWPTVHPVPLPRLERQLLFLCAQAAPQAVHAAPCLRRVRHVFRLQRHSVVGWQKACYDEVSAEQRDAVMRAVKNAKAEWSAYTEGQVSGTHRMLSCLSLLEQAMAAFPGQPNVLVQRVMALVENAAPSEASPISVEVATLLLYLEASASHPGEMDLRWAARLPVFADRMQALLRQTSPGPLPDWVERICGVAVESNPLTDVAKALKQSMAQVEQRLEVYFGGGRQESNLQLALVSLGQIRGVFALLSQSHAVRSIEHVHQSLSKMASERVHPSAFRSMHDNISANIGGLSLLVNELGQSMVGADDDRWLFDEHLNTLRPRHVPLVADALACSMSQTKATSVPPKQDNAIRTGRPTLEIALGMPKPNAGSLDLSLGKIAYKPAPEIVGVFREEAQELLAGLREVLDTLLMQPHDLTSVQHVRRTFHTLKGSARMAQLSDVGDIAWNIEQKLNGCLANNIPIESDVVKCVLSACREIAGIVDSIPSQVAHPPHDVSPIEPLACIAGRSSIEEGDTVVPGVGPQADSRRVPGRESLELSVGASSSVVNRRVGSTQVSAHLFRVFMSESLALAQRLSQTLDSWVVGEDPLSCDAESCAHTLAGAAATIGFHEIAEFARQLELASHEVTRGDWRSRQLPADMPETLRASAREMMTVLGLLEIEQYKAPQVERLIALVAQMRDLPRHLPMTSTSTIGSSPRSTLTTQRERSVERYLGDEVHQHSDVAQRPLFDAQVDKWVQALLRAVRDWVTRPTNPEPATDMLRCLNQLQSYIHRVGDQLWADQVRALATQVQAMALLASVDDLRWLQGETEALCKTWSRLRFKGGASVVRSVSSYAMQTTLQPVHQESIQAVSGGELAAVQGALTDLYAGLERLRSQLSEIESKSRAGGPTPE